MFKRFKKGSSRSEMEDESERSGSYSPSPRPKEKKGSFSLVGALSPFSSSQKHLSGSPKQSHSLSVNSNLAVGSLSRSLSNSSPLANSSASLDSTEHFPTSPHDIRSSSTDRMRSHSSSVGAHSDSDSSSEGGDMSKKRRKSSKWNIFSSAPDSPTSKEPILHSGPCMKLGKVTLIV